MADLSIIIPVRNEARNLQKLLPLLMRYVEKDSPVTECIVVDGGSDDDSYGVAKALGANVVQAPRAGRAIQMNYGAKQAAGDLLYFLHADTVPPEGFDRLIESAVTKGIPAGCFRLRFDHHSTLLNFYGYCTRFDIDLFRFGDQSLFIEKSLFEALGGYNEQLPVMEDQEFVRCIRRKAPFTILPVSVITSSRKYKQAGTLKLQIVYSLIVAGFYMGVSPDTLTHLLNNTMSQTSEEKSFRS